MSRAVWAVLTRAFRRTALPLASYYSVTLGLPVANGASRTDTDFVRHALVVLVVPLAAIVLACAVRLVGRTLARRAL